MTTLHDNLQPSTLAGIAANAQPTQVGGTITMTTPLSLIPRPTAGRVLDLGTYRERTRQHSAPRLSPIHFPTGATAMNGIQAAYRQAEFLREADRARQVRLARAGRGQHQAIVFVRRIVGVSLIRAGERLQGLHRAPARSEGAVPTGAVRLAR